MDTPTESSPVERLERGVLPAKWTNGTEFEEGPAFLAHAYNLDFYIVRQAGRTHFEKPFLYLLFGAERAMLVDTGAPGADVAGQVQALVARWTTARKPGPTTGHRTLHAPPAVPLIVTHTHGHSDHVAGDAQFAGVHGVTLVGTSVGEVRDFFSVANWPEGIGRVDLGSRPIDVVPIPGHEEASVAFYDRRTGVLLSGDLLYPGRLYVRDAPAFRASVARLVEFTRRRPVSHILGAHIENTRTPFLDYPEATVYQPDEHPLELGRAHLLELSDALAGMGEGLDRLALRDFTIWPVRSSSTMAE